jgi:hypothetical protein
MENATLTLGTNATGVLLITATGRVSIGNSSPTARFESLVWNGSDGSEGGVKGNVTVTSVDKYGVQGMCNASGYYGYGVQGYGGWYGGYFEAGVSGTLTRYGVHAYAGGTNGTCYGIYAEASGTGLNFAGYFSGNVFSTGTYTPSDADLKLNVKMYDNALAMINTIPVKTYSYKNEGIYGKMHLPEGNQVGIMAQDLEAAFPQLVKESSFEDTRSYHDGLVKKEDIETINFKAVNYTGLVPVMVKAMQEQNELIQKLEGRIKVLEAR